MLKYLLGIFILLFTFNSFAADGSIKCNDTLPFKVYNIEPISPQGNYKATDEQGNQILFSLYNCILTIIKK